MDISDWPVPLIRWLTDRLPDQLAEWLTNQPANWPTNRLTGQLTNQPTEEPLKFALNHKGFTEWSFVHINFRQWARFPWWVIPKTHLVPPPTIYLQNKLCRKWFMVLFHVAASTASWWKNFSRAELMVSSFKSYNSTRTHQLDNQDHPSLHCTSIHCGC